jgi:hypothetical protein
MQKEVIITALLASVLTVGMLRAKEKFMDGK